MRKIKLDKPILKQVNSFYTELFRDVAKFQGIDNSLDSLLAIYPIAIFPEKHQYIDILKQSISEIACADINDIQYYIDGFNNIIPNADVVNDKDFYSKIIYALGYNELRSNKNLLGIYKQMGINSCVYCNAQLNVVLDISLYKRPAAIRGTVKERKALFELDHIYSKSNYPFLCISFFNLVPACSNCNKSKSYNDATFKPYTYDDELDVFAFSLTNESIIDYWKTRSVESLEILFQAEDTVLLENHNDTFRIKELYNTQKDVAEELLHKAVVYNKIYKQQMVDYYTGLFPDTTLIDRLLVGNYTKPDEVHKRPLSKFIQDISRQLGLIPKI